MSKADESLIYEFTKYSTGASVHDDRNLLLKYVFFIEHEPFKGMEIERQMRSMLATRKLAKIR